MTKKRAEMAGPEGQAAQILSYLKDLDPQAQVDASFDIELALREGHGQMPVWLRPFSREAVQTVRQRIQTTASGNSVPDTNSN